MPLEAGAPPLSSPALRATPGAGNRLSPSRWTRCGLRSGCAATRPGFPRLRLGARGCASHFGTGVLGDASHSATVYDLPVRALRPPPVRCRAAGAARAIAGCGWTPCPTPAWPPFHCSPRLSLQDAPVAAACLCNMRQLAGALSDSIRVASCSLQFRADNLNQVGLDERIFAV